MRRLLLVAYYFPPLGGIGSLRAVRYLRHLPQFGWDVTVLTSRGDGPYREAALCVDSSRVVRSWALELSVVGKRALRVHTSGGEPAHVRGHRSLARTAAHRYLYFPDAQIGWYPGAVTAGAGLLRRERFDAILSSAHPITAHLIARTLHRRTSVPWVAEFRDPWAERLEAGTWSARRAQSLERRIAREATALVMPSWTWSARYERLWRRRVVAIPNGFDADMPPPEPPPERVLSYVGSFYPELQDLAALWQVMSKARAGAQPLRLRYIGAMPNELRYEIAAAGVADLVHETGYVTHAQALRLSACSAGLVVAGPIAADELSRGRIAGKVFEYLASGLPVIYVGDPDSDVARLLSEQPECHVVAADAPRALGAAVAQCDGRTVARDLTAFSSHKQAESLATVLDGMQASTSIVTRGI